MPLTQNTSSSARTIKRGAKAWRCGFLFRDSALVRDNAPQVVQKTLRTSRLLQDVTLEDNESLARLVSAYQKQVRVPRGVGGVARQPLLLLLFAVSNCGRGLGAAVSGEESSQ